ncbi:sulfite exporter TauE/SafE family protein [Patescibacteria group bacterium]|nr:sulfite exporter TauE/SafE family protein [Patescibacteria group bacterium]
MIEISIGIAVSAFIAGLITFLAPCTLPLVPAYLGFISGVSKGDLENPDSAREAKKKVFRNGVFFILGFSIVFIIFGALFGSLVQILQFFGIGPTTLEGEGLLRIRIGQVSGLLVILFGAFMLGLFKIPFLQADKRIKMPKFLKIGKPTTSLTIGGAFAFGWTPCVGPILGSILLLASSEGSILQGALLLAIFSMGLAVPFLLIAFGFSQAMEKISNFFAYLSKHRVGILGVVGFLFGLILDLVVVSIFSKFGVNISETLLQGFQAFIIPTLSGIGMALIAKRHEKIDVLGVGGGLFLVALGALLVLGSFGLLVQYGFLLFGSGFEELLFEYL